MKSIRILFFILFFTVTGCAHLDQQNKSTANSEVTAETTEDGANTGDQSTLESIVSEEEEPLPAASFEAETLYDLIIAELAGKESRLDVTLGNYQKHAKRTNDLGIIARYLRIAKYMHAHQATLDAANLWLAQEPTNLEALQAATLELIRIKDFDQAIAHMDTILSSSGEVNFDFLILHAKKAPPEIRTKLIDSISSLIEKHPDNSKLWFTYALLLDQNRQWDAALTATRRAIQLDPQYISALIIEGKILSSMGQLKEAVKGIKKAVRANPDHLRLRVVYLKMLLEEKDPKGATEQISQLVERNPRNWNLKLRLALIAWENKLNIEAKDLLKQLIASNQKAEEAHTYLAQVYASEKDYDSAIAHYKMVKPGPYFASANIQLALLHARKDQVETAIGILEAARTEQPESSIRFYVAQSDLLIQNKRYDEAWTLLTGALAAFKSDTDLLYSRAMLAEKMDRLDQLETDLREILVGNPESSLALNALGYTLADRTDRLEEALELISKAYAIEPDDPAIIDSMGWINYRLGNNEVALGYLKKAYELFDDHEIAAHLGEVLWVMGKHDEARRIWDKAETKHPNSEFIRRVKEKLNISE